MVKAVAATGTPTVVVVMSGRAHVLTSIAEVASALVQTWPPGEQGGHALADVLFGKVDATGRLPVSLLRSVGQVPEHRGHRGIGDRSLFYGDYTDCPSSALFPFGHGLSYTTFEQGQLRASAGDTHSVVSISVVVRNTGKRAGEELVQLYATDLVASVSRPEQQLVSFARVYLEPGESRRVTFDIHPSRLAFYDEHMRFVVEPGEFRFATGTSALDLHCRCTVELAGEVVEYSQRSVVPVRVSVDPVSS